MTGGAGGAPLHLAVVARAVAPLHGAGGLERAAAAHIRALAGLGARLTVFTPPADPAAPPPDDCGGLVRWQGIPYRRLPLRPNSIADRLAHYPAFARRAGRAIVALAAREPLDIVHAHGLAGRGYAEQAGDGSPPLVLNPHGMEEFSRRAPAKWLAYAPFRRGLRRAARGAAAVIATDRALLAPIAAHLGLPADRLALIPNGVELDRLDALIDPAIGRALRARYRLDDAPLVLVSIARLERNKGLADGLAALATLRHDLPPGWRWLIVGRGGEEDALRAAIGRLGLAAQVALVGPLPDAEAQNLLAHADLCLIPSHYEGSSLTALEALARRVPVVATPVGGLPDKVLPGATGFLAAATTSTALAAALRDALAARDRWPALGAQARALVARDFAWPALAARYVALYRAIPGRD